MELKPFLISACTTIAISTSAFSFEIDGFKKGMSLQDAKKVVEKQKYEKLEVSEDRIQAWDAPGGDAAKFINIGFCKGKLVQVEKHLQPRFDFFTRLVEDKRIEHGKPIDAWSRPVDPSSSSESSSVSFVWKRGKDFTRVSYTEFKHNNQLSLIYETYNSCWAIPY